MELRPTIGVVLLCAVGVAACDRHSPFPPYSGPETCTRYRTWNIPQSLKYKLDFLFVVENSPRMASMVPPLPQRIRGLLKPIADLADIGSYVDIHVGLVTTDMGAGATGSAHCEPANARPRAVLQPIGAAARAGCHGPVDANWIRFDTNPEAPSPGGNNLPAGQSFADTVDCMAAVGYDGCDYPQPLEAAYAALRNPVNVGFVRDDALLVIAFVTAQEDCSAPDDTLLFDPDNAALGPPGNWRCTRAGVECEGALPIDGFFTGRTTNCTAIATSRGPAKTRLHDVGRYVDYLQQPRISGGVKDSPLDVVMITLDGPETPFLPLRAQPGSSPLRPKGCSPPDPCTPQLLPSCTDGEFFGTPNLRLGAVRQKLKQWHDGSVCDQDWSAAGDPGLSFAGDSLGGGCLRDTLRDPEHPDCAARDIAFHTDGTETSSELPHCTEGGPLPCWNILPRDRCPKPYFPQGLGVIIQRDYYRGPPHTNTLFECAFPCPP